MINIKIKKSSRRRKKSPKKASNEGKKPSKDDSEGKKQDDSEKEEGEIDSNEESEEGRYRSYSSDYSSSSSYDSRYSRSRSRSPSKQKKSRHHSRRKRVDMGLIQATLNEPAKKSFPKAKAGIEAVDSEEDFDSPRNGTSKFTEVGTEMVPRADRTNISFSFTKKSHTSVLQGTDLEFGRSSRINKEMLKKADKDQIVISSDSEGEGREKNGDGSINPMMAMDDGANSIIPLSDQSDLKLCEETVMARDILTEIQHDEEDINHDPVIKMESKEEENVVNSSETPAMSSQINNSDMSLQINSSDMSSQINNSDIRIKQEVLEDPAPDPSLTSSTVVKSEPWDEYLANPCEDNPFSSQQTTNTTEIKENLQFQEENLQFQEENQVANQVEVPEAIPPAEDSSEKDHSMAEENETVEDEEDGGGLVDLPENEQDFAFEDDEEENSSKYRMEDLPNRPNVDEESSMMSTFTPSLSDADNSNLLSENLEEAEKLEASENLDEAENLEEAEVSGLVELPPEEAEALTAITSTGGGTDGDSTQNNRNSTQNASAVPGSSWSTRWLQSEKVQKVVSSSRMLSRVRNKIKKDKTLTKRVDSPALEEDSVPVINSMEEYKRVVESSSEQKEAKEPQQEPPPPVVVDDSSDEDSQDDELWSKMMGN